MESVVKMTSYWISVGRDGHVAVMAEMAGTQLPAKKCQGWPGVTGS